ncbi:hypothetical protein KIH86_26840 [Paenibacillus sp. HN-1]|uniref:hypothetical protein n=1 Tax=Paenibacillus TaxID=44249 RepID=UPI001CA99E6B|nr:MULTISPECIES: hypothetical protein [Paenibacillus]MBY9077539.1 hypothetical protein [Paenibacillus sp. CGMCC 1.18879]MBY9087810.1 hypothetical protein [Paenibacillus sinensis]
MSSPFRPLSSSKLWNFLLNIAILPWIALIFQVVFVLFLLTFGSFLLWSSPRLFWELPPGLPTGSVITEMRMWLLAFGFVYALVWCGYWRLAAALNSGDRIPAFTVHVLAAWLPLLVIIYWANPVNNPDAMIPISQGEITFKLALAMITAALFPFYSAAVYILLVIRPGSRICKGMKLLGIWALFATASLWLFPVFWRLAPEIYPGIAGFPVQ